MGPERPSAAPSQSAPHALRDFAFVADGERGFLLGPRGDIVWMCFPVWESDAVFSSLLGGYGAYTVTPEARCVWGGSYEPGTLIWRSRWVTDDDAIVECREALALPTRGDRAVLLRRVTAEQGRVRVGVFLNPRAGFGAEPVRRFTLDGSGEWRGRAGPVYLRWRGGERAVAESDGHGGRALRLELELEPGEHHDLVLVLASDRRENGSVSADTAWSETENAWPQRVPALDLGVAGRDATLAYAVLSGLTCAAGGMIAAPTTSLPEHAREGRNYDYRYVWIRDQCFVGQAAAAAGPLPLLDDAVRFVGERLLEHGPDLRPAYTTAGGRLPRQRSLDLPGYPGGGATIGNRAGEQFQLDIFGEALLLFAAAERHDRLEVDSWHAVELAAQAIEARWRQRDAGIWELEPDEYTHSRLICAAGLRAISACVKTGGPAARWLALADTITADASARALHPSGRWQRSTTDSRPDASLLLAAVRGAIPPDDPRTLETLRAVEDELTEDGYVYRYRPDERPLGDAEGAFLLCGFLLALAWAQQGDAQRSARWFERNRGACGPPGLLAEEFDVTQRQLRGNLPQAFVHALLLECAVAQAG
jgi:GH15 family glucan-1,4-alpha-glucosidase